MGLERCKRGCRERGEFRICRKGGSGCWIRFAAAPIFGERGESLGAVVIFDDITEARKLSAEARQTRRSCTTLYRNAPCGYHSLDEGGVVIRINDTELGWLGYAVDEVVGKVRFTDLLPPRYADRFNQNFALLKECGWLRDTEYEMRRKDGSTFPVLVSTTLVKDSDGRFLRSCASVFDISEQKRAKRELSESEVRNTAILQAALDCIVSIDSQGRIIEFNPAAGRTFGCTRAQAVGKNVAVRDETIFTVWLRDSTKEAWADQELRRYADGRSPMNCTIWLDRS